MSYSTQLLADSMGASFALMKNKNGTYLLITSTPLNSYRLAHVG